MHRNKRVLVGGALFISAAIMSGLALYARASALPAEREIHMTAKKFEFTPETITLKKGEPVILELNSLDRLHGFVVQDLKLHADIPPNKTVRVPLTPEKAGTFEIACDIFCGTGHEGLRGTIVVTE